MPVPQNKTNFKTYESITRLLAAVLATTQGKVKLDFKDLASLMGGGTTASAVDHRLRPVKQLAKLQAAYLKQNMDPGTLPVDGAEIQKLFGESTAGGISWQIRELKALGRAQQAAVDEGRNPAEVKPGTSAPAKKTLASTPAAKRTGKAASTPASTGGKRKRGGGKKVVNMSEEESDDFIADDSDYEAKDRHSDDDVEITPTPKRRNRSIASSQTASVKKNGDTVNTDGVARTLFSNGSKSAAAKDNDEVEVVDLSDDATNNSPLFVKAEQHEEEDDSMFKASDPNPFDSDSGYNYEDEGILMDGEI
ncbi:hypothetical protein GGR54DRAFT_638574 [Hypoxylon sp. NC1633]|nr:hypothetical protein GGR54DRAFT_638574 [Hypoxylon sp. NC1633]